MTPKPKELANRLRFIRTMTEAAGPSVGVVEWLSDAADALEAQAAELEQANAKAAAMLKTLGMVEWLKLDPDDCESERCPLCDSDREIGHLDECPLDPDNMPTAGRDLVERHAREVGELKSELHRLDESITSAAHDRHGASGLCCQLREQELKRAEKAEAELATLRAVVEKIMREASEPGNTDADNIYDWCEAALAKGGRP